MARHLVFVFGTLKEGFPNFATNSGRRLAGTFVTCERYPLHLVGPLKVQAYLKRPELFSAAEARLGPLAEYTLAHAALYRPRA